jgi:predicted acetyltransferase
MTDDLKIESVLTVGEHRRRGYARAVVAGARRESRVAGHELTFLTAEEAEGPLALYSELGFVTVARVWDFARESDG